MNATAFQPRATTIELPREQDWDRLPWLADLPGCRQRSLHCGWLLCLISLISADAVASYWAGEARARQELAALGGKPASSSEPGPVSRGDARILAERISQAQHAGLEWRRPNAPY